MTKTTDGAGIGRASFFLASGTMVSRLLGFVKAMLLATTIGLVGSRSADAFGVANQLPNTLYVIIAGGVLSAVLVPSIVRSIVHADGGKAYINKLLTITFVVLIIATVAAVVLAPVLVHMYSLRLDSDARALAVAFAYWCLPQIFFYGLYTVLGEILNAHKLFGPFTWSPVINNIVSMAGLVVFIVLFGADPNGTRLVTEWTPNMVTLLGGTATVGVAAQAIVLFFFWRRIGLRYRPDFAWRGVGLRATGKLAGWSFAMLGVTTIGGLIQTNVALIGSGYGPGPATLQNAWLIYMLPHSVITLSVATAYFTRLSEHVREDRIEDLKTDVSAAVRQITLLIVLATSVLLVVAFPFASLFTGRFADTAAMAFVLMGYLISLVPFAVLFVFQRTFYALGDTRTPFFFTLVQTAVYVGLALACAQLPKQFIGIGLAVSMSISIVVQMVTAGILLRKRIRGLEMARIIRSLTIYTVAAIPAVLAGVVLLFVLGGYTDGWALSSVVSAVLTMALIGVVMLVLYLGALAAMRSEELRAAMAPVTRRLRRR
ncbi:murein biosynthesis integral membrane protein MurJ [Mycetocola zhadangensis]|uniref:Murein biosynthesis integral membrane protein MurJ n=1 Tax=Mycetocola zhadangensis TaxID=1164595 RepID=A0A3L7J0T9_9MICO|nr:murein biosynthesis integral membrane protein MurJ [Mycetocola zhadangensis]RLQ84067.1 murein biosynthesis integral membrane protein MurJ [Mycetocola zhadangensis]GGE96451.1 lipid II flippase MurJ [Mycetocola zhadangensis]